MASGIQSNPVYYSLTSSSSSRRTSTRTVVLHRRPNHEGFGVYIGEDVPSGLYIVTVERNSPAADAHILPGDRVLAVNGQPVSAVVTNQKDMLVRAAANAQSLTLTIQSTDLFQTLDVPLTNTDTGRIKDNYVPERPLPKQTYQNSMDLESYIKSLFGNENVEILAAPNNTEYVFKAAPQRKSPSNFSSLPNRSHHSTDRDKEHRSRHRHHHHRQSKPVSLQTIATQTSFEKDNQVNTAQEQPTTPLLRTNPTKPSMGKSQLATRTELQRIQQTTDDNKTPQSQKSKPSTENNGLDLMGQSPSSASNKVAPPSPKPNRDDRQSTKNETRMSRMADVVTAAVAASKKTTQPNTHEQTASDGPTSAVNTPVTSPPSRDSVTAPPSRRPPETAARKSSSTTEQSSNSSLNRPSPPPYTPAVNNYASPKPRTDRNGSSEGAYNVSNAEATQRRTSTVQPGHSREVHLTRLADFQGFGFHLQYNKAFYLVQRIESGGPAEKAGLHPNDVILSINQESTETMPHVTFVQIVNNCTEVSFLVQPLEDYLRTNPQPVRPQHAPPTATATPSNDQDKPKSGISKALGKLTNR